MGVMESIFIILAIIVVVGFIAIAVSQNRKPLPELEAEPSGKASGIIKLLRADTTDENNQIRTATRQILESTWIMANSKTLNTVYSRYNLCLSAAARLESLMSNSMYKLVINLGISDYIQMYPDKPIMKYQETILENPTPKTLNDFYCSAILYSVSNYVLKEAAEISDLKQKKAIERRKDIIRSNLNSAISELSQWCSSCENYNASVEQINKMLATISAGGPMVLSDAPGQVFLNE